MTTKKPGRGSDQFPLRLPDGMRDQLKQAADQNGRSMNAEMIDRLEASLSGSSAEAGEWKRRYEEEREASARFERLYESTFDVAMNYKSLLRGVKEEMLRQAQTLRSFASLIVETEVDPEVVDLATRVRDAAAVRVDRFSAELKIEDGREDLTELETLIARADGLLSGSEKD